LFQKIITAPNNLPPLTSLYLIFYQSREIISLLKILSWDVAPAELKMENQAVAIAMVDVAQVDVID
jgi:hypothetical protein